MHGVVLFLLYRIFRSIAMVFRNFFRFFSKSAVPANTICTFVYNATLYADLVLAMQHVDLV
ncbi:hypothetical protein RUMCAL_02586 [Ruminococcus callidus ATCC 27760]|uniref:Uncharacterized protein n=1 Tax=Ruminococcus callidus ATCC 27760 TaxID=411473 RepID=U2LPK2_9FIRM|nr:hypothetical protein RUMCAL_02586 [Ruminococcus callidus ATCC 27760]